MLQATIRTKLYRIPGADREDADGSLLPGERSRLRGPLQTYGSADSPDTFDIRERVPAEFSYDESPQEEGRRARRLEEAIAAEVTGITRLPDEAGGDTTKGEDNEE